MLYYSLLGQTSRPCLPEKIQRAEEDPLFIYYMPTREDPEITFISYIYPILAEEHRDYMFILCAYCLKLVLHGSRLIRYYE